MCYYDQVRWECGYWKWGKLRVPCSKKSRENDETCSLKLVHSTSYMRTTCKLCDETEVTKRAMRHIQDFLRRETPTENQAMAARFLLRRARGEALRLKVDHLACGGYTMDGTEAPPLSTSQSVGEDSVGSPGKHGALDPCGLEAAALSKSSAFSTPAPLFAQFALLGESGSFGLDECLAKPQPFDVSHTLNLLRGKPGSALDVPAAPIYEDIARQAVTRAWSKLCEFAPLDPIAPISMESVKSTWEGEAKSQTRAESDGRFMKRVRLPR